MSEKQWKFVLQSGMFVTMLAVDAFMFHLLMNGLAANALTPGAAALLGSLVTAITGSLGLAAKDLFSPND